MIYTNTALFTAAAPAPAPPPGGGLFLDEFPQAVAGYSLRKLRDSYAGPAVQLSNGSQIGFDANGDLDLVALSSQGTQTITYLFDQSVNDYGPIEQGNGTWKPQFCNSGNPFLINGKPAIYFDWGGSIYSPSMMQQVSGDMIDQVYSGTDTMFISEVLANLNSEIYPTTLRGSIWNMKNGGASSIDPDTDPRFINVFQKQANYAGSKPPGAGPQTLIGYDDAYLELGAFTNLEQQHILAGRAGTSLKGALNNNAISTAACGAGTFNVSYGRIALDEGGGSRDNQWLGYLQELILFNTDESANATAIQANVNAYYGIY